MRSNTAAGVYDYRQPGEMCFLKSDAKSHTLVGRNLRQVNQMTAYINEDLMLAQQNKGKLEMNASGRNFRRRANLSTKSEDRIKNPTFPNTNN